MISNSDYIDPHSFDDHVVAKFACSHCDAPAGQHCEPSCICVRGDE